MAPKPVSAATVPLYVLAGAVFGFGLAYGRVHESSIVVGQMTFSHFVMLKMFLTASAVSMIAFFLAGKLFGTPTTSPPPPVRGIPATVLGAMMLGLGMTLSGSCPGTVWAQLGAGSSSAIFVLLGGLTGVYVLSHILRRLSAAKSNFLTHTTLSPASNSLAALIPGAASLPVPLPLVFAAVLLSMVAALELLVPWRSDIATVLPASGAEGKAITWAVAAAPSVAGLLVGIAQFLAITCVGASLGSSSSFGCIVGSVAPDAVECSYLTERANGSRFQVVMMGGVVLGAFAATTLTGATYIGSSALSPLRLFLGGLLIVAGAQLSGGCTSGHGLTGMGMMSVTSTIAVAAMFGTAIVSGLLMA